jgi:hypothetical protein
MRFFPLVFAALIFLGDRASAQTPLLSPSLPGIRRSVTPAQAAAPKGSQSKESAEEQKARFEASIAVLKDRIGDATNKVMAKIIDQEKDLRMRLGYFEKEDRLDPNNFASKEEIQNWQKLVDQFQQSRDLVAKLYGNASEDLETALVGERIAPALAGAIRKEIISSFPWDDIAKKDDLITTYTGFHRQLLTFFDQNWKAWNAKQPYFTDQKLESDYEKLREQIASTSKTIDTIYTRINF